MIQVNEKKPSYDEFKVDITSFDALRKPGISAILRIKNGAEFLRASIETHIPYYDEIIACYNDCTDNTAQILNELKDKYPEKIKVFEYLPKVYPIFSDEHNNSTTDNVHSLANFYNYTLSKVGYKIATKLDDDHIAIDRNLAKTVAEIRRDMSLGIMKIYTFSGVNLAFDQDQKIGVYKREPLVGTGDHLYFPVSSKIYFSQERNFEAFKFIGKKLEKKYMGIMYFHLKYLKNGYGFLNLEPEKRDEVINQYSSSKDVISLNDFISEESINKLSNCCNRVEYWLRKKKLVNSVIYTLFRKNPPLRIARLHQLNDDLNCIDLEESVIKKLIKF